MEDARSKRKISKFFGLWAYFCLQILYLTLWLFNLVVNKDMTDQITSTFSALADPTRRAILARLALGETSVTEIAAPFEMSMPAISRHLKVLEKAGLISRGREAQWRPCKLKAEPLKQAADWLDEYRRFWEESFDRLDEYLKTLQTKENKDAGKKNGSGRKRR
ncbi:ArsR/SmtB family transcription factor [Tunturiibacter gelidiferens]|uniref:ArsR/SmtB family transcription factor n=1 Tax=Tunturiibacter gelidiferens TaxID=3069689 RepID=UPI003D9AD575